VRTRTGVVLVAAATILLAVPFAFSTWAFGGPASLVAFVLPLTALLGIATAVGLVLVRASDVEEDDAPPDDDDLHSG
jgi:ABC-type Na+ efflux pump permease subunit